MDATVGSQSMRLTIASDGPPLPETDEQLVQQLRENHPQAGQELVSRYSTVLLRYLHRMTGNEHAAEDLHQQTWTSVLENIDRFSPTAGGGGFKSWLFRIATNKAHDRFRSRRREAAAVSGLRLVRDSESDAADATSELTDDRAKLQRALDQLPENQRQVVLLRYYSDLKFVEIAETIGCPLNTALGRMHKAMLKLKTLMDAENANAHAGAARPS